MIKWSTWAAEEECDVSSALGRALRLGLRRAFVPLAEHAIECPQKSGSGGVTDRYEIRYELTGVPLASRNRDSLAAGIRQ